MKSSENSRKFLLISLKGNEFKNTKKTLPPDKLNVNKHTVSKRRRENRVEIVIQKFGKLTQGSLISVLL